MKCLDKRKSQVSNWFTFVCVHIYICNGQNIWQEGLIIYGPQKSQHETKGDLQEDQI